MSKVQTRARAARGRSTADHLTRLPLELLDHIASCLAEPDAERFTNKKSLQSANATCKALHVTVTPWLFRSLTVNITLSTDASGKYPGRLAWARPRVLNDILDNPRCAVLSNDLVKEIQLRLLPFPVADWSNDNKFDTLVNQLDRARNPGNKLLVEVMKSSRHAKDRQQWVFQAYYYASQTDPFRLTGDPFPQITDTLRFLPNVEHIEPGYCPPRWLPYNIDEADFSWERGRWTRLWHPNTPNALNGGFGTVPFGVSSLPAELGPANNIMIRDFDQHLVANAGFIQELDLDICDMQTYYDNSMGPNWPAIPRPQPAAAHWHGILNRMYKVGSLALASTDTDHGLQERSQYLGLILKDVVMPSVTQLRLSGWVMDSVMLSKLVWKAFPSLQRLDLQDVVLALPVGISWQQVLDGLPVTGRTDRNVRITVRRPRHYRVVDGRCQRTARRVGAQHAETLRDVMKGHPERWQDRNFGDNAKQRHVSKE